MSSMHKKANLVGTIESLLKAVGADATKSAAEAHTEAGGYMGETTHPVKDVDDRTEEAQEGARSAENTEDAKTEPNRGQPVDSTSPGPGAGQDSVQMDIGITSKSTGDDPSAETDSTKPGKQDPGSSHPARTDNTDLDGSKYSSDAELLLALAGKVEKLGSDICAYIATNADPTNPATKKANLPTTEGNAAGNTNSEAGGVGVKDGPITTPGKVEAKGAKNTAKESSQAANVGHDLAGVFAGLELSSEDKQAADHMVVDTIGEVIATACRRAEKCAEFYASHFAAMQKAADEAEAAEHEGHEGPPPHEGGHPAGGDAAGADPAMAAAGGGGAGGGAGGGHQLPPEIEALLMQLLQGGEHMGAGDAAAGMEGAGGGAPGGADMAAAGGGMPPGAGAGGMPPGGGGGMEGGAGGGGGGGPHDAAMLEQILGELGVSPEEVQAKAGAAMRKQAKWQPKTAADREKYARMKQVITELTGRSSK